LDILIRQLQHEETEELLNFLCDVHGHDFCELANGYIKSMFSEDFRAPIFIAAIHDSKIIGVASYTEELFTTDTWGIAWVGVREEYRRKSIGERIIKECLKNILLKANKTVTVLLRTHPKQTGLYDKIGFSILGDDHEGGKFMKLTLEKTL